MHVEGALRAIRMMAHIETTTRWWRNTSIDCFNDTLMNERLKDFTLTCNEHEQAMQWNGKGFAE